MLDAPVVTTREARWAQRFYWMRLLSERDRRRLSARQQIRYQRERGVVDRLPAHATNVNRSMRTQCKAFCSLPAKLELKGPAEVHMRTGDIHTRKSWCPMQALYKLRLSN